jgi:hypothetical protein
MPIASHVYHPASLVLRHDALWKSSNAIAATAPMRLHSVHARMSVWVQLRVDRRIAKTRQKK